MLLECSHCGGPLDVREGRRFTRCAYCGKTSETSALRTVAAETPPGWRPPKTWVPPAHVPADSAVALQRRASAMVVVVVAMSVATTFVGVLVFMFLPSRTGTIAPRPTSNEPFVAPAPAAGPKRVAPAVLASITLRESPEALEAITGVAMDAQKSMRVPLADPCFEAVTFQWDPDELGHVKDFHLAVKSGASDEGRVRKGLRAALGRRLDGDTFHWAGASMYAPATGGVVSTSIQMAPLGNDPPNPFWKQQSEALWAIVRRAAFGVGAPPNADDVRAYLGGGEPVGKLLELDLDADIDASDPAVRKVFAGATRRVIIDLEYAVAIDHPWYGEAELAWRNEKGARLAEVSLRPPPGTKGGFANQDAIDACVEATFGKPSDVSNGPHIGGDRTTTWRPAGGGEIRVYRHMVRITLRDGPFSSPMPKATWRRAIEALDRCGRPAE